MASTKTTKELKQYCFPVRFAINVIKSKGPEPVDTNQKVFRDSIMGGFLSVTGKHIQSKVEFAFPLVAIDCCLQRTCNSAYHPV